MLSLHHTHLMASDIDATIAFWRDHFDAELIHDVTFAGARNVFLRIGTGRLHLYDQAPKHIGPGAVHHLGIETDVLENQVARLMAAGISVTKIRTFPDAAYAMAKGPDGILIEIFQINHDKTSKQLHGFFDTAHAIDTTKT